MSLALWIGCLDIISSDQLSYFTIPAEFLLISKHGKFYSNEKRKFYSNELPTVPRKLDLLNSVEIPLVENLFWKFYFEEFVLSSRRVSPLTKPFLDPCYMGSKMRSVYTEKFHLALYTIVSRNEILFSEIYTVKLIVAWWLFSFLKKCVINCSLPISQREKMSSDLYTFSTRLAFCAFV